MENDKQKETEKPVPASSLLDEVRVERLALEKVRDEARAEANRLESLKANQMLSGTGGKRPEMPDKPETNSEYRKRVEKEISEGKYQ